MEHTAQNNALTHVTLTGVDDHTDLTALALMSARYPLVEWGFLYSPKRQGTGGRYPSVAKLLKAFQKLPANVRVALHVCGEGVPNLLKKFAVETNLVEAIAKRGGRVQLNFNQSRSNTDLEALAELLDKYPTVNFITQHNEHNKAVWRRLCAHANFFVLFDESGGRGVERTAWPVPLHGIHCGYAGGLGPLNLADQLPRIQAAAGCYPHWIDMENKLRTSYDTFCLDTAEACLRKVEVSLCLAQMNEEEKAAVVRFCDTCNDDEGYDVPRWMMKRLEELGLVKDKRFGRFYQTLLLQDVRKELEDEAAAAIESVFA